MSCSVCLFLFIRCFGFIFRFFDLLDDDADEPPAITVLNPRQRLQAEMAAFTREASVDRETPGRALAYWQGQSSGKPLLYLCALHHLAIQASRAPSERLFSVAGRFYKTSRARLSTEVFEATIAIMLRKRRISGEVRLPHCWARGVMPTWLLCTQMLHSNGVGLCLLPPPRDALYVPLLPAACRC